MTVTNTTRKKRATGNGVTTSFPFPFKIFNDTDLIVSKIDTATTPETVNAQTLGVDYTVIINTVTEGGSVEYTVPPILTDEDSFIVREVPETQPTDYPINSRFPAKTVEDSLDKAAMRNIEQEEDISRSVKLLINSSVASAQIIEDPIDGRILHWDGTTGDISNSTTSVTSFDADVTATAANAAAAAGSASAAATSETNAAGSATDAANSAAGVSLPPIQSGDATKQLGVNAGETGYEIVAPASKVWLSTVNVTSPQATVDFQAGFDFTTYKRYILEVTRSQPVTDGDSFRLRYFVAGSVITTALYSASTIFHEQGTTAVTGATQVGLTYIDIATNVGGNANDDTNITITLFDPAEASDDHHIEWKSSYRDTDSAAQIIGVGELSSAGAIDGLRIYCSTSDIDFGVYKLYGVL
jgi:hypothetical protein